MHVTGTNDNPDDMLGAKVAAIISSLNVDVIPASVFIPSLSHLVLPPVPSAASSIHSFLLQPFRLYADQRANPLQHRNLALLKLAALHRPVRLALSCINFDHGTQYRDNCVLIHRLDESR